MLIASTKTSISKEDGGGGGGALGNFVVSTCSYAYSIPLIYVKVEIYFFNIPFERKECHNHCKSVMWQQILQTGDICETLQVAPFWGEKKRIKKSKHSYK